MAQTGRAYFKLKVQGSGGHGSSPHMANDAIVAGAQFVTEVQTIVSRRLSPFETALLQSVHLMVKVNLMLLKMR